MKKTVLVLVIVVSLLFANTYAILCNSCLKVNGNKIINYVDCNYESIKGQLTENYDITVLVKLNYNDTYLHKNALTDVDKLKEYRDQAKSYYLEQNSNIVNKLDLSDYNYSISYYAPFVEIVFDNLEDYENSKNDLVSKLDSSNDVANATIGSIGYDEATVNESDLEIAYPLVDAFSDIGVSNLTYTGNGVRVGTLEHGVPDDLSCLKPDKYTELSNVYTVHSTLVTAIIGGYHGIAEDVHLFCKSTYFGGFTESVDTLIDDYQVNVINMSHAINVNGIYDNYCAYIDYIVANTGCTFVAAAGNDGAHNGNDGENNNENVTEYLTSPGCGMNVITVGSMSANGNVSYFSSWDTINSYLNKPDMVAPGENISNVPMMSEPISGTSFSAPMVTGIVALLMEEFPVLKINPSLVKAALHNGCVPLSSQESYFDQQCGFGLVNYQNARNYLNNSQYTSFGIPTYASDGNIVASRNVTIPSYMQIEINADWVINSVGASANNNACSPNYTKCYIKLFDLQTSTYVKTTSTDSNMALLSYSNFSNQDRQYRIDIVVNGAKATGGVELGALVYHFSPHVHNYDGWAALNSTFHVPKCACGATLSERSMHMVDRNYIDPTGSGRYKPCLYCGYMMDTWSGGNFPIIIDGNHDYITL